jgi:hypothetical protein
MRTEKDYKALCLALNPNLYLENYEKPQKKSDQRMHTIRRYLIKEQGKALPIAESTSEKRAWCDAYLFLNDK